MSKLITVKKIDNVVIQIFRSRGRVQTNYFIPTGMSGNEFALFKTKNIVLISYLKTLKDGKSDIIKTEEEDQSKLQQANNLLVQSETPQGFSDYLQLQGLKLIGGKFRGH
jgi:hypothetical protein